MKQYNKADEVLSKSEVGESGWADQVRYWSNCNTKIGVGM